MRTRLKLFVGSDEQTPEESTQQASVPLAEFARVIADAVEWNRTWLKDFSEEQVVVSQDLHEIIRLYDEIHQVRA